MKKITNNGTIKKYKTKMKKQTAKLVNMKYVIIFKNYKNFTIAI